jgi:hypothetical protein
LQIRFLRFLQKISEIIAKLENPGNLFAKISKKNL